MKRHHLFVLIPALAGLLLAGCGQFGSSEPSLADPTPPADAADRGTVEHHPSAVVHGDGDTPNSAVKQALLYLEKYTRQLEVNQALRDQNEKDRQKIQDLEKQAVSMQARLDASNKELASANEALIELQKELNNWKADVLGYRKQTLDGMEAQLRGINMILKMMGYTAPPEPASATTETPTAGRPSAGGSVTQ